MIIGVDADITFFKSGDEWLKWLSVQTHKPLENFNSDGRHYKLPYNLAKLFEVDEEAAMRFWHQPNLYDNMPIQEGAIEAINHWMSIGHKVGFITYCKSGHFSNKCHKLKEIFPNLDFINVTKEKQYSKVDVMIDDRVEYLEGFSEDVTKILIDSKYAQNKPILSDITLCKNWYDIRRVVECLD